MKTPLNRLPATELARLIATGDASCESVAHSFVDAVHEAEPDLHAFAHFDAKRVLEVAREFDAGPRRGLLRGPLHGLPVAVKDNIDTASLPSEYGSAVYRGHRPSADAACVAALSDAGAYVLGKTVTAELANFTPGATRNPHQLLHTPGGSSSGSAAAVAAHMAPFALGTQTAGSVIRPAAYCGVVGFVPSRGRVPRSGVKAVSDTLDTVGVMARNVADAALIGAAIALAPDWPAAAADPQPPALAVSLTPWAERLSPVLAEAIEHAGRLLVRRGARATPLDWSAPDFAGLASAQQTVQVFETARALGPEADYRRELISQRLAELIAEGRDIAPRDYLAALALGRRAAPAIDDLFGAAEVALVPAAPGEAPRGLGSTGDPLFNRAWHFLGCPQISLPLPHASGEAGLPLAVQLVARPGADARLLSAAAWVEAELRRA